MRRQAAALAIVLVALLPVTRPGRAFSSDEGAAIIQARVLEETGSWVMHEPLAAIDPEGDARPIPHADTGRKGRAPYAKHPVYPLLLAAAERVAGSTGFYLLSLAGTLAAAIAAARLARLIDGRLEVAALWVTGVGSPLFFNAFWPLAHSLGAAAAGGAALAAARYLDLDRPGATRRSAARQVVALVTAGAGVAGAVALRSEAALFAVALGVGAVVVGRARGLAVAAVAAAAAGAVRLAESAFVDAVVGGSLPGLPGGGGRGFISGQFHGLLATWFTPSYVATGVVRVVLPAAAVLLAAGALAARWRWPPGWVTGCWAAAAGGYVAWLVAAPPRAIPGLALAFPVGWGALWLLHREAFRSPAAALCGWSAGLFTVAVLLTQYERGGGVEWGGRYFALGLPLAVPVLVAAASGSRRWVSPPTTRQALATALVTSVSVTVLAVAALRHVHGRVDLLLHEVEAATAAAGPAFPGGGGPAGDRRPVVVTPERLLPQILWNSYLDAHWLAPERAELGLYLGRLGRAGARRAVLLTAAPVADLRRARPHFSVRVTGRAAGVTVAVLEAREGASREGRAPIPSGGG